MIRLLTNEDRLARTHREKDSFFLISINNGERLTEASSRISEHEVASSAMRSNSTSHSVFLVGNSSGLNGGVECAVL